MADMWEELIGYGLSLLQGLVGIKAMSVEDAQKKLSGFKVVEDGVICSVDDSTFIADANVRWIFTYRSYTNPTTGSVEVERLRSDVVSKYADGMTRQQALSSDGGTYILKDDDGKNYYRGLLYKNKKGGFFVVTFQKKARAAVFLNVSETMAWCEDHLTVDKYEELFG
jgi:hypothetical protein